MKSNTAKKINNDTITVRTKSKKYENEIYVNFKGKAKNTKIIKAQFYFKNKITGKIITKTDFTEFDNGRLELPDEDYSKKNMYLSKSKFGILINNNITPFQFFLNLRL